MNVAIFTDNDFQKINGVTTALRAVLEHAPADIRPRVYTCDGEGARRDDYLAVRAAGMGLAVRPRDEGLRAARRQVPGSGALRPN